MRYHQKTTHIVEFYKGQKIHIRINTYIASEASLLIQDMGFPSGSAYESQKTFENSYTVYINNINVTQLINDKNYQLSSKNVTPHKTIHHESSYSLPEPVPDFVSDDGNISTYLSLARSMVDEEIFSPQPKDEV